jgi:hypothetical protein
MGSETMTIAAASMRFVQGSLLSETNYPRELLCAGKSILSSNLEISHVDRHHRPGSEQALPPS